MMPSAGEPHEEASSLVQASGEGSLPQASRSACPSALGRGLADTPICLGDTITWGIRVLMPRVLMCLGTRRAGAAWGQEVYLIRETGKGCPLSPVDLGGTSLPGCLRHSVRDAAVQASGSRLSSGQPLPRAEADRTKEVSRGLVAGPSLCPVPGGTQAWSVVVPR